MTRFAAKPQLRVVKGAPVHDTRKAPDPEAMLAKLVPELIAAEENVAALRALVDSWRCALARQRGVAFIRQERIRQEFGQ